MRKLKHDVTQEDDVETIATAPEWKSRCAENGPAKVAHLNDLGSGNPVLADVFEVANDEAGGQTAIHFDAMVSSMTGAMHCLGTDVCSFDANVPSCEQLDVLVYEHGGKHVRCLSDGWVRT